MEQQDDEKIYPIANWDIGPIEEHQLIVFRPHYISSPEQNAETADPSRYYALTLSQAKDLKLALENAIGQLENINH